MMKSRQRRSPRDSRSESEWTRLPHEELLDVRICDLGVAIEDTWLERQIAQLYRELGRRGELPVVIVGERALRVRKSSLDQWIRLRENGTRPRRQR